jgi:hypothetical protein
MRPPAVRANPRTAGASHQVRRTSVSPVPDTSPRCRILFKLQGPPVDIKRMPPFCRLTKYAAALFAGAVAFAAATVSPQPAAAATSPLAIGVNLANAPDQIGPLQSYINVAHKTPAIVMWYQQWSEPLYYSDQLANMSAINSMPMITWDPSLNGVGIPLSQIVAGKYDAYVKSAAQAAIAWKRPMYIRFAHEMNLTGSAFGPGQDGNTPAEFVAAWRHVVNIFRQQGATNVEWVWSPNVNCGGKCPFTAYYPGDAWVDWVALDGYNYSSVDKVPWETFDQVFSSSYAQLTALAPSKPVMIAETASADVGGNKAQWITQAFQQLPTKYPKIHAVVWFDQNKEANWMVNSSSTSMAAWQQTVASSTNGGTPATLAAVAPTSADVTSGATTGTTGASGLGKPAESSVGSDLVVHRPHAVGKVASALVSCTGTAKSRCGFSFSLTTLESVSATAGAKALRERGKTDARRLVVGRVSGTLSAGKHKTIRVRLDATAQRVLEHQHGLDAELLAHTNGSSKTFLVRFRTAVHRRQPHRRGD